MVAADDFTNSSTRNCAFDPDDIESRMAFSGSGQYATCLICRAGPGLDGTQRATLDMDPARQFEGCWTGPSCQLQSG